MRYDAVPRNRMWLRAWAFEINTLPIQEICNTIQTHQLISESTNMNLRTQPVVTRGDEKLRDIYSDASDIPVATRVHHTMADEMVRRWNNAPLLEAAAPLCKGVIAND